MKTKIFLSLITLFFGFLLIEVLMAKNEIPRLEAPKKVSGEQSFPVYLNEFLDEMGIRDIPKGKLAHIAAEEAMRAAGLEDCFKAASKAVDPESGGAYFKITKENGRYIVKKTYPLEEYYIIVSVFFYIKDGKIDNCLFTQSVAYADTNLKRYWQQTEPTKKP